MGRCAASVCTVMTLFGQLLGLVKKNILLQQPESLVTADASTNHACMRTALTDGVVCACRSDRCRTLLAIVCGKGEGQIISDQKQTA